MFLCSSEKDAQRTSITGNLVHDPQRTHELVMEVPRDHKWLKPDLSSNLNLTDYQSSSSQILQIQMTLSAYSTLMSLFHGKKLEINFWNLLSSSKISTKYLVCPDDSASQSAMSVCSAPSFFRLILRCPICAGGDISFQCADVCIYLT